MRHHRGGQGTTTKDCLKAIRGGVTPGSSTRAASPRRRRVDEAVVIGLCLVALTASMCNPKGGKRPLPETPVETDAVFQDAGEGSPEREKDTWEETVKGGTGAGEGDSATGKEKDELSQMDAGPEPDAGHATHDVPTDNVPEPGPDLPGPDTDTGDRIPEGIVLPVETPFVAPRCGHDCSGQLREDRSHLWSGLDLVGLDPYQVNERSYFFETYNIIIEDFPYLRFSDSDLDRFQAVLRNKPPCVLQGVEKITILPHDRSSLCGHFSGSSIMLYAGLLGATTKCGSMTLNHEICHALDKVVFGNALYDELFDQAWGPDELGIVANFPTYHAMENPNELFAESNSEGCARGPATFLRAVAQAREGAPGIGDTLLRIMLTTFKVSSVGYTDRVAFEYIADEWAPSMNQVLVPAEWREGCTGDILQDDIQSVLGIDLYDEAGRPNLDGIEALAMIRAPMTHLTETDALRMGELFRASDDNDILGLFLRELFAFESDAASDALRTFVRYADVYPPELLNRVVDELTLMAPGIDRLDKVTVFLGIPEEDRFFFEETQGPLFHWAVDTLAALGGEEAIAALGDLFHAAWLSDSDKRHIIGVLGEMGGYAAIEELAYLTGPYFMTNLRNAARDEILRLIDDDPTVTEGDLLNMISLLVTIGTPHAADIQAALLFHESGEIRQASEEALLAMGSVAVPGLRIALGNPTANPTAAEDDAHNSYGAVARILGQLRTPANLPSLLVSLNNVYPVHPDREAFWSEVRTALELSSAQTHLLYATSSTPAAVGNALTVGTPEDPLDSEVRRHIMGLLIPLGGDARVEDRVLDILFDARYSPEERDLALALFRVRNPDTPLAYGTTTFEVGITDPPSDGVNPEENHLFWAPATAYLFGHHHGAASVHGTCQNATAWLSLLDTGVDGLYVRFDVHDNHDEHDVDPPSEGDGVTLFLDMNGSITESACMAGDLPGEPCGDGAEWFPKWDGSGYNVIFHLLLSEEERQSLESGAASINALWTDRTGDQIVLTWLNAPSGDTLSQFIQSFPDE